MASDLSERMSELVVGSDDSNVFKMAPKPAAPRTDNRGTIDLVANAYTMKLKDTFVQPYTVNLCMRVKRMEGGEPVNHRDIPLVKETAAADDYMLVASKDRCRMAMAVFRDVHKDIFDKGGKMFYDMQRLLYSAVKLFEKPTLELTVERERLGDIGKEFIVFGADSLILHLTPHSSPLYFKDFGFLTRELVEITLRHDLPQFLEIGSSQTAYINPDKRVTYTGGLSYEKNANAQVIAGQKRMWKGVQKSVRFFENDKNGEPVASLILDAKKSLFHVGNVNLIDKVYDLKVMEELGDVKPYNIPMLSRQLKGLFVEATHLERSKAFRIHSVVEENCLQKKFTRIVNDVEEETTIADYFLKRYNRPLQFPNSPVVAVRGKTKDMIFYPMEVLSVCENQRVTTGQTNPKDLQDIIKASAILPKDRMDEIQRQAKDLKIQDSECNLGMIGIRTNPQLMSLKGRTLAAPQIAYADNRPIKVDESGKWRTARMRYIKPAEVNKWAVFLLSQRPSDRDRKTTNAFVNALVREAGDRGMRMGEPVVGDIHPDQLEATFAEAAQIKTNFMVFVQDSRLSCHKEIKFLERKYQVWTQDLNLRTVSNVVERQQRLTLEHILNKINVKLGGVNYKLAVSDPTVQDMFKVGRLYIGVHMNRSSIFSTCEESPKSDYMITGISANISEEPCAFVGDFFVSEQRFDSFYAGLNIAVERYAKAYNAYAPLKEMVVYFGGVSDGDFSKLLGQVVEGFRNTLEDGGIKDVNLTVIVVSKHHNIRIMPRNISGTKATEQNIKPGVAVDEGLVHNVFAEFFVNSHLTLQGTGKAAKYTVIVDDSKFDIAYLEKMSYSLAYGHQIVAMPTSLPTPAYVAKSYSERGTMLVQTNDRGDAVATGSELSYANTVFAGVRLNA